MDRKQFLIKTGLKSSWGSGMNLAPGGAGIPYIIDFRSLPNGGLKDFIGATWAVLNNVLINTPTLGGDFITDGGFENWNSNTDLASWTETVAATTSFNKESTTIHGGTYSARMDVDSSSHGYYARQATTLVINSWVKIQWWARASAVKTADIVLGEVNGINRTLSSSAWIQYTDTLQVAETNPPIGVQRISAASTSIYFDDFTAQALTTSTLFAKLNFSYLGVGFAKAGWKILLGNAAGVVGWWDGVTAQQNCLVGECDGVTATLKKYVGSTKTAVIAATAITYVEGAFVEIRRVSGTNTFQLFYNGLQVGADQTISDVEIINNQYFGLFSTDSNNQASQFILLPYDYPITRITILGDSISDNTNSMEWPAQLTQRIGYGNVVYLNHAVSGNTIQANMAGQITAALSDNPTFIIVELGTNDLGTHEDIQTSAEANLDTLITAFPSIPVFWMNVLPRWNGGVPQDKTFVRTAVADACLAKGITCWDTYTLPWVLEEDMLDGTHPNLAGSVKIANQQSVRLP